MNNSRNWCPGVHCDSCDDNEVETLLPYEVTPWSYYARPITYRFNRNVIPLPDLCVLEKYIDRLIYRLILKTDKFYPDDIVVTQEGRMVTLECKQAEQLMDGCWMSCHVVRRIQIPAEVDMNFLETRVSNDYTLSILGMMGTQRSPRRNVPVTLNVRLPRQQLQEPEDILETEPRGHDMHSTQRLIEAAYRNMNNQPGYAYWNIYPDSCDDTDSPQQTQHELVGTSDPQQDMGNDSPRPPRISSPEDSYEMLNALQLEDDPDLERCSDIPTSG